MRTPTKINEVTMIALREQLIQEIYQVPEEKLAKVLKMIQHIRLQPVDTLLDKLRNCIHAPSQIEQLGEFKLDLTNYRFDREDANAR